ncbi:MAG: adenylate/guanylate cyclase domain-containing protein [archaeon]|nr:adenylate/guanylate cyclase domain-containing protein [archaeon]
MAKRFDKLTILIFSALFVLFLVLISLNSFSYIKSGISDKMLEEKKPLENIVIIKIDDDSINKIGRWPWDRDVFARLIEKTKDAKVVGIDVSFFEASSNDSPLEKALSERDNVILASEINYGKAYKPIFNTTTGYVNLVTDYDGVTRRVSTELSDEMLPFAFEIYKTGWESSAEFERRTYLINFASFKNKGLSAHEVLAAEYDFKNKIVLIGATAPNLHDNYFVPTSQGLAMGGVEIHGSVLQNLILEDFLKSQSRLSVIFLVLVLGMLGMFVLSRVKIIYSIPVVLLILVGYSILAILAVSHYNYLMDMFFVPLSLILFTGAGMGMNYMEERKQNKYLTDAFGKYVSRDLVNEIVSRRQELKLGGSKREITVFFSDIRDFTPLSEKLSPEELVSLVNEYMTEMTKVILKHNGTVDKFVGDAIMAIWNAPLEEKQHALLACQSAVEQIKVLGRLNKKWAKKKINVRIGCGINTGEAIIGNMGSEDRFDYTAIGDNVNLASRLEELTKEHAAKIIVAESTYLLVKNKFKFRRLGSVKVKGKNKPVNAYELVVE